MKASDLRNKTIAELNEELNALFKQMLTLRIKKSLQDLTDTSFMRKVRKDIARVRTVLTEKKAQQVNS